MGTIIRTTIIGFFSGLLGAYVFQHYFHSDTSQIADPFPLETSSHSRFIKLSDNSVSTSKSVALPVDFSQAASRTTPSVVYINSISKSGKSQSYWDLLFDGGESQQTQISSGSGVILRSDGYIVTNNHVVETAEKIQVIYNKKSYDAELVGSDPSTDLAVLKISETNLPAISIGSSKNLLVGEWVVAVGNPFSLSSTVTVGVVSAKGRRINVVNDKFPIESFIQTDAAINPGNSGGALVNKNGELVGINTAIISSTGSYSGYAFAVPVDIAYKVVGDIIKYGVVQKAFFGGDVMDYNFETASKYDLETSSGDYEGVALSKLVKGGATINSGISLGDIITKIDSVAINSKSQFEEELSYHYPGDKIVLTYLHDGKLKTTSITLVNKDGETSLIRRKIYSDTHIGASLEAIDLGIKVTKIMNDGLFMRIGIPENYVIMSINRTEMKDPQEVIEFFSKYRGRVYIFGVTSSKNRYPFDFILQ